MRIILWWLLACGTSVAALSSSSAQADGSLASVDCQNAQEVQSFLADLSSRQAAARLPRLEIAQALSRFWARCGEQIPASARQCFFNFRSYVDASPRGEFTIGVNASNLEYYAWGRSLDPNMYRLPDSISANQRLYENWRELFASCRGRQDGRCAEVNRIRVVEFGRSCETFEGAPDEHSARGNQSTVFFVPGPGSAHGRSQAPFQIIQFNRQSRHFAGHIHVRPGQTGPGTAHYGVADQGQPSASIETATCVQCHSQGPRRIVPTPGSVDVDGARQVEEINRSILRSRPPTNGPFGSAHQMGPNVAHSACIRCHGDNHPLTAAQLHSARHRMLFDLTMPPNLRTEMSSYFSAMALVPSLGAEDRARVRAAFQNENGLPCDLERVKQARRFTLSVLRERGLISAAAEQAALRELPRGEERVQRLYSEIEQQMKDALENWLRGGAPGCVLNGYQEARTCPATEGAVGGLRSAVRAGLDLISSRFSSRAASP